MKAKVMNEKEFENYVEELRKSIIRTKSNIDSNTIRCFIIGWIGATKDILFTGQQIERIFEIAFE